VNRLATEPSRYLRQHGDQPVDWFPWGPEAFAEARRRDVPMFVSVGYSACHWCHVMAHETFDDAAVAEDLNRHFVAVKVDREERPDVDAVYMDAVVAMTGSGGWPMSVFTTPDGRPFLCGTYFPPEDRHGLPAFRRVLQAVAEAWQTRRGEVEAQADALAAAVAERMAGAPPRQAALAVSDLAPTNAGASGTPEAATGALGAVARALVARADRQWGGFGGAPKFPQPSLLQALLTHHQLGGPPDELEVVVTTLGAMAAGGIYDHLGGGFARYATDTTWTVPHFEKMLYDQAGLLRTYLAGWLATGDERWRQVVEETVGFVLGDLRLPDGGLAAALDADSEGEEGRYYVWSDEELQRVLGPLTSDVTAWYQADGRPAFEGRHILRRPPGAPLRRPPTIEAGRQALLAARAARVPPGRDDKVVTEWNAMAAGALADAAAVLGQPTWGDAAAQVVDLLLTKVRLPGTGRLARTWQDGEARHAATAADYAWLVDACTRLAELTGQRRWVVDALALAEELLGHFVDPSGLLAMTADDAEPLVARPVELVDGATPSASAVASVALARVGTLADAPTMVAAGERLAASLLAAMPTPPLAAAHGVTAAALVALGVTEVTIGTGPSEAVRPLLDAVRRRAGGTTVVRWGELTPPAVSPPGGTGPWATVCRRSSCLAPVTDADALRRALDQVAEEDRRLAAAGRGTTHR